MTIVPISATRTGEPIELATNLLFCDAVRVWAAAAGIAGAFLPRALVYLVEAQCPNWAPNGPDELRALLRTAEKIAEAENDFQWGGEARVPCRSADVWPRYGSEALVWVTSVELTLSRVSGLDAPNHDGWRVTLSAPHPEREAAGRAMLERIAEEEAEWVRNALTVHT